jgi:hypothetical protein
MDKHGYFTFCLMKAFAISLIMKLYTSYHLVKTQNEILVFKEDLDDGH